MNQSERENSMDAGTVIAAALIVSAIGALFYNLLPLYIGAAQDYRGLDNKQIGFLSSAFFLGFNVVTISAFFWIRNVPWTTVVATAAPTAAISLYAGTLFPGYSSLLVATVIAGGAFAALYGLGTVILGDTSNPARWYGVKIAAEAFAGAVLLLILPGTAIARWGFDGVVFGMIICMIFLSPFLFWIPKGGGKWQDDDAVTAAVRQSQNVLIWGTLLATLIFFSGASAMWAFVERIGAQGGYDPEIVGALLSGTLIFALLGSVLAAALAGRFGNIKPYAAGGVLFLTALYTLHPADVFTQYAIGACLLTLAIGFMLPIAITEIAELDIDGRYVVLSVPAIGIGAMTGPAIAGILTQSGDFLQLLIFGAGSVLVSTTLLAIAGMKARRGAVASASRVTQSHNSGVQ
jgi:predicted MFS family arabinose efflux permease